MNHRAVQLLLASQLVFLLSLLLCFLIDPNVLADNRALSLYGSQLATILPYALGLLLAAYLLVLSAQQLDMRKAANRTLSRALVVLAILLIGIVLTPIRVNFTLLVLHALFSFSLFILELIVGFWLVRKTAQDWPNMLLFGFQIAGQTMVVLSLDEVGVWNLSATGQIVAVTSFAVLLMRAIMMIEHENVRTIGRSTV